MLAEYLIRPSQESGGEVIKGQGGARSMTTTARHFQLTRRPDYFSVTAVVLREIWLNLNGG
jgi:hypothetical protein